MANKKEGENTIGASVSLRVLADSVGRKWYRMLADDCTGLGHIHDIWNEMYRDMRAIVCLEHYITEHEDGVSGVDFGKVRGIDER